MAKIIIDTSETIKDMLKEIAHQERSNMTRVIEQLIKEKYAEKLGKEVQ